LQVHSQCNGTVARPDENLHYILDNTFHYRSNYIKFIPQLLNKNRLAVGLTSKPGILRGRAVAAKYIQVHHPGKSPSLQDTSNPSTSKVIACHYYGQDL
jgi:hypothetical protein